ncbi:colicin-like pore-forming protein, partial [Klebsiella pneumoniae]
HEERLLVDPQAAEKTKQDLIDGISFISTMNERILQQYGEKISEISKALQSDVSGKKIRSYHEAMATFEKIRKNPR